MFKSKKLSKFKNIRHGFFNRQGGVSKGIYRGLNCGLGGLRMATVKDLNGIKDTPSTDKLLDEINSKDPGASSS